KIATSSSASTHNRNRNVDDPHRLPRRLTGEFGSRDRVMELSDYHLETLHQDGELILSRGCRRPNVKTGPPSILVLSPAAEHPASVTIRKIEQEFSFKDDLSSAWAVRPIALTQRQSRPILLFEDPGGEPLARVLPGRLTLEEFLHCGIALTAALGGVHRRGL